MVQGGKVQNVLENRRIKVIWYQGNTLQANLQNIPQFGEFIRYMHLSPYNSYIIHVFLFVSKAIIQNGRGNVILETPYKMGVNL